MTDHERLREQYEDALFALLMEGVAESEGEEALRLNEELKKDPNAEVPKDVQKRCEKTIRSAFAQKQLRATGRTAARWLTKWLWSQFWEDSCSRQPLPFQRM